MRSPEEIATAYAERLKGKALEVKAYGERYAVGFFVGVYGNGRVAVRLDEPDGQPFCKLTVDLPESDLDDGECFVKTWEENAGAAAAALASGLFVDTGKRVPTGYCEAHVWRLA